MKTLKKITANIAIIPARSGSRRIKNKNIKIFNKKPVIYWSIKQQKKVKFLIELLYLQTQKKLQKYQIDMEQKHLS